MDQVLTFFNLFNYFHFTFTLSSDQDQGLPGHLLEGCLWSAARVQKGVLVGPPSAHVKAQSTASSELSSTGFNYYVTKDIIIYQRCEDSVHAHCVIRQ